MISAAVWYLDRWSKHELGGGVSAGMMDADTDMAPAALTYALATAGIPAVHIAALPYHKIVDMTYDAKSYVFRTQPLLGRKAPGLFTKWGAMRFGAKVGARFIPGVGWVLLAYDLYTVGKWYMETDF